MTENTFDQEAIDDVLDAHDADSVDELPAPVRNNIEAGPDGIDPFQFLRNRGDDNDGDECDVHLHVHVDGGQD